MTKKIEIKGQIVKAKLKSDGITIKIDATRVNDIKGLQALLDNDVEISVVPVQKEITVQAFGAGQGELK